MLSRLLVSLLLLTLSWAPAAVAAAEAAAEAPGAAQHPSWSRFRGPNGSGVTDEAVPVRWEKADYDWKIELPGQGHSSPVVWGDRIFVTAADEDSGERLLVCVNAGDGTVAWQRPFELKPFNKHGDNSYASSTPAVDEKYAYVQWTSHEQFSVVAVRHDGAEAWRADLGPYKTQHGGGGSPIVHGESVIVNVDQDNPGSFVAALDRGTGKVRWRTPRDSTRFSTSTPCVYTAADGREQLVFTTHANGFTALDPASGKVVWELPGVFPQRVVSSPVVGAGLVFGGCGEGPRGVCTVAVAPPPPAGQARPGEPVIASAKEGEAKPRVAYQLTSEVPYVPTPIVYRGWLFTWSDSGTVTCHVAATGERVWQENVKGGGGFFGSPVCAGGNLYCVSKRGEVFVVRASDKFEPLARNELGEASHATPAVANGRLILRTVGHLISVGGK